MKEEEDPETKKCTKCGKIKPLSEFYADKNIVSGGHRAACKPCEKKSKQKAAAAKKAAADKAKDISIEQELDTIFLSGNVAEFEKTVHQFSAKQLSRVHPVSNYIYIPLARLPPGSREHHFGCCLANLQKYFIETKQELKIPEVEIKEQDNFYYCPNYEIKLPPGTTITKEGIERVIRLCSGDTFVNHILIECDMPSIPKYEEVYRLVHKAFKRSHISTPDINIQYLTSKRIMKLHWDQESLPESVVSELKEAICGALFD